MVESTKDLFALPNKILFMESNQHFTLLHAPTLQHSLHNTEIACMDCKPVLKHIESFSYSPYRKRKI